MKRSALSFTFPLFNHALALLVSAGLMVGCTGSNSSVSLRENTPAPGDAGTPDNGNKPTKPSPTPTPENPGDGGPTTPTPTPATEKVARIICESQPKDGMTFNTLRADVMTSFSMPGLTVYVDNQYVLRVKSPVPLQSDGENVFFILRARKDDFTPWKIYKSTANLLISRGDLQVISNYPAPSNNAASAYQTLKLENRLLTANVKRTAYVYPNDAGTYTWESLKGSKFTVPFNAETSFSPSFTGGDDYLRFDQIAGGSGTLTQKFYNFVSEKILSLPAPADSKDFQLFSYINAAKTTVFWAEGRPGGVWKLRSMSLGSSSSATTLGTLPGNPRNIILPMVITESQGEVVAAYGEEEIGQDQRGQVFVKTGVLHLVKASAKLAKLFDTETIEYSDEIKNTPTTAPTLQQGVLRSLFLEPISGKLYASIVSQGGLASFDLKRKTWETHAMVASIVGCLNPEWGTEVPRE